MAKEIELDIEAIDGELVIGKADVWAFYALPERTIDFMDKRDMVDLASGVSNALAGILPSKLTSVECQLYITSYPFSAEKWAEDYTAKVDSWRTEYSSPETLEVFETMVANTKKFLYSKDYNTKLVIMGIKVGTRASDYSTGDNPVSSSPLKTLFNPLMRIVDDFIGQRDLQVTDAEIQYWRKKASVYARAMSDGYLNARPATAGELAMLIKRGVSPMLPLPPMEALESKRWGKGEIVNLVDSVIKKHPKFLKVSQDVNGTEVTGYRATLCISKFPDSIAFPEEPSWTTLFALLGDTNLSFHARFSIVPAERVRADLNRKIKETKDEARNAAQAGLLPQDIAERQGMAEALEYAIERDGIDWIYSNYRIFVEGISEENLRDVIAATITLYRNHGIELAWPSGDQWDLFLEGMPGDRLRVRAYEQRQLLNVMGGGMPMASSAVGD